MIEMLMIAVMMEMILLGLEIFIDNDASQVL